MKFNYLRAISISWGKDMLKLYPDKNKPDYEDSEDEDYGLFDQTVVKIKCNRDDVWHSSLYYLM